MLDIYSILQDNWWKLAVCRVANGEKPELVLATFGFIRASNKDREKIKETRPVICAGCNKIFTSGRVRNIGYRTDKKWCSSACRQKMYRSRLLNGEKIT